MWHGTAGSGERAKARLDPLSFTRSNACVGRRRVDAEPAGVVGVRLDDAVDRKGVIERRAVVQASHQVDHLVEAPDEGVARAVLAGHQAP